MIIFICVLIQGHAPPLLLATIQTTSQPKINKRCDCDTLHIAVATIHVASQRPVGLGVFLCNNLLYQYGVVTTPLLTGTHGAVMSQPGISFVYSIVGHVSVRTQHVHCLTARPSSTTL